MNATAMQLRRDGGQELSVVRWWVGRVGREIALLSAGVLGVVLVIGLVLWLIDPSGAGGPGLFALGGVVIAVILGAAVRLVASAGQHTKPLLRSGATRRSIIAGHWALALFGVVVLGLLPLLAFLLLTPGSALLLGSEGVMVVGLSLLSGLALAATLLVAVAVVLRWGWGVGAVVLLAWWVLLPMAMAVLGFLPVSSGGHGPFEPDPVATFLKELLTPAITFEQTRSEDSATASLHLAARGLADAVQVVVLGAIHWLIMRTVPVE